MQPAEWRTTGVEIGPRRLPTHRREHNTLSHRMPGAGNGDVLETVAFKMVPSDRGNWFRSDLAGLQRGASVPRAVGRQAFPGGPIA